MNAALRWEPPVGFGTSRKTREQWNSRKGEIQKARFSPLRGAFGGAFPGFVQFSTPFVDPFLDLLFDSLVGRVIVMLHCAEIILGYKMIRMIVRVLVVVTMA